MTTRSQLPILVDMDGVFADFVGAYYRLAKQDYPDVWNALPRDGQLTHFYLEDNIEDPEIRHRSLAIVDDPRLFGSIEPLEGALEGLKRLDELAQAQGSGVLICTAPHKSNKSSYAQKAEWVEKYLGYPWLEKLLIVRDKTAIQGRVLIDDKPEPLGKYAPVWTHVVFDQSYNQHVEGKPRMLDWSVDTLQWVLTL